MAILLVSYDLKQPGRNYKPLYDYFEQFNRCHGLESEWLVETTKTTAQVRDDLMRLVDSNDILFVNRLAHDWGAYNYPCATWLNDPRRAW